jgi:hypothetical protein
MSRHIPDWVLERHLVGELPEGFTAADLAADPSVPERLEKLKASDAEILEQYAPRVVAAQVRARSESRRQAARRPMMVLLPAAALAAVVVVVVALPKDPDILTKGLEPHLEVFRKDQPQPLVSGVVAQPGDVVQLRVVPAGAKFGMVVAVDGEGAPVLVTPTVLPLDAAVALPDAMELDATGDFQRFILVTSDRAFEATDVVGAARSLGKDPEARLQLPGGMKQSSFVIYKAP